VPGVRRSVAFRLLTSVHGPAVVGLGMERLSVISPPAFQ
jgi:hypothetical protein